MIRRLFEWLLAWIARPLYNEDDPLDEYWQRKHYDNEWWHG
ncbi:MAG: hypothetical protein R6U63_05065 [Longimicrobiales bacterium]